MPLAACRRANPTFDVFAKRQTAATSGQYVRAVMHMRRVAVGALAAATAVVTAIVGSASADTVSGSGTVTVQQKADPAGYPAQCNDPTAIYIVASASHYGGSPTLQRSMDSGVSWTDLGQADAGYPGYWHIMNRVNGAEYRVYAPAGSFSGVGGDTNTYSYTEAYSNVVTIACSGWDFGIPENDLPPGVTPPPCPGAVLPVGTSGATYCDPNARPDTPRHASLFNAGRHQVGISVTPAGSSPVFVQVKVRREFRTWATLPVGGGVTRSFRGSVKVVRIKVAQDAAGRPLNCRIKIDPLRHHHLVGC